MSNTERHSPSLPPDRVRELVVELEQHGVDSGRIDVVAAPAQSVEAVSEVDQATVARPIGRAALGSGIGAALGAIVGLLLSALTDMPAGVIVGTVIAWVVLGGLYGLYAKLPVSTDVVDVETGQDGMVKVDVDGLDGDEVAEIDRLISQA